MGPNVDRALNVEFILNLWARGFTAARIGRMSAMATQRETPIRAESIQRIIRQARLAGDERAAKHRPGPAGFRHRKVGAIVGLPIRPEFQPIAQWALDVIQQLPRPRVRARAIEKIEAHERAIGRSLSSVEYDRLMRYLVQEFGRQEPVDQ